ncbi:hypothetical protein D0Z00_004400 [Geotrichum galactomycetum]|uniref:Uncharacterized protein n=1 Tax=Geotrichum galactomycetum TaxID=27317 RepID=A0ACB6UYP3_9ASCO|nr:hypothetical protein D0Z00_004400 [Geotrichum candidum]
MTIIPSTKAHLQAVLKGSPLDPEVLNKVTDQLKLDKSLFVKDNVSDNTVIIELLPLAIGILKTPVAGDVTLITELIHALLAYTSFEDVIRFISTDQLLAGLDSGVPALQNVCVAQIAKAKPADLVANTPLVDKLLELFADKDNHAVQSVQDTLVHLASNGELVVRRIFGSPQLSNMKNSDNAVLQSRLMALLESVLKLEYLVDSNLLVFDAKVFDPSSASWDVLQTVAVVQFYRTIIENPHVPTLVKTINGPLEAITKMFSQRDKFEDVKLFLLTEIYLLFRELSYKNYDLFKTLDGKFNIVNSSLTDREERVSALTFINPRYIFEFKNSTIEDVRLMSAELPILRNLVTYEPSFTQLGLNQQNILNIVYGDMLILLLVVIRTPFGLKKLLHEWPQVMNAIINKENVREPEIFNLRREALELLYNKPAATLGAWYGGVKEAYKEVILGAGYGHDVQAIVADKAA